MSAPTAQDYDVLTFDCYGTLIDWGSGIVGHLQPVLLERDAHVIDEFLLEFFAETEPVVQADGVSYANVLREVLRRLGERLAFSPTDDALDAFAASVGDWEPFPDTVEALARLDEPFDLAIVSNVDNALFERTAAKLGVDFKHVVTAEDVGAYKPDRRMFDAALAEVDGARVLHVAQSVYHDIVPATALGLDTVWIRRAHNAARPAEGRPAEGTPTAAEGTPTAAQGAATAAEGTPTAAQGAAADGAAADATPTWSFDSLGQFADAILAP